MVAVVVESVTGEVMVHGQLVTVTVVAELTVYVWELYVKVVAAGQKVVKDVTT